MSTHLNELNRLREMEEEVAREKGVDAETGSVLGAKISREPGIKFEMLSITNPKSVLSQR